MSKKSRSNIEIQVTTNLDKALKQLKKKIEREGVVRDMKRLVYFEPPTQKRRKRLMRAIKQNLMRMATQGLLKPRK
ncbi:30S ribosomal protein S21 [Candidatus Dependentiae bacterium]